MSDQPDNAIGMPLRVGIILDHPSPHMLALIDTLAEREDCCAQVIYLGKKDVERRWEVSAGQLPYRFLKGITFVTGGLRLNPGLIQVLREKKIDVWLVNSVYTAPSTLIAAWVLSHGSTPWVFMNEPPRPRNQLFSAFKMLPFRFIVRRAWGVIGMGEKAVEIYRSFLNGSNPTTSIPYYLYLEDFFQLSIPGAPVNGRPLQFFACSQMIHRKGLDILLQACKQLRAMDWKLTLVGDGPLRRELELQFSRSFQHDRVIFRGEVPYEKRHEAFAGHHIFVFPSRWDGWGMVIPEALAAGLPVVTTDQVIAAHEFIENGVNGFIVPADDPSALAQKMAFFINHPERIEEMALAARRALINYRPEKGGERLIQFLKDLVRRGDANSERFRRKFSEAEVSWKSLTGSGSLAGDAAREIRRSAKGLVIRVGNTLSAHAKPKHHKIIVYHLVLPEDRKSFEEHIQFLRDHFGLSNILEILNSGESLECKGIYRAAITFDDGFQILMGDCLEILEKYRVRASFYIPAGSIDISNRPEAAAMFSLKTHYYFNLPLKPMKPEDLKLLVKLGHEVGSHGLSHIGLQAMSFSQAMRELNLSRDKISEWTGVPVCGFAYPYGHAHSLFGDPSEWVRKAGYTYAVTLKRGGVNKDRNPFLLPREHIEGNWSVRDLRYFLLK